MRIDHGVIFVNKLEFGKYLSDGLAPILADPRMDTDIGLWSWLALQFFDQVCPANSDETRKPGAHYRYILSRDYKHLYRHLVRTPCIVYHRHGVHGRLVLSGALHKHGEASEQLLSREHVFSNKPLFQAMDRLYIKNLPDGNWRLKRGASGSGGGSFRRMGKVVKQFDLTYDISAMTIEEILGLLPAEFDLFKK